VPSPFDTCANRYLQAGWMVPGQLPLDALSVMHEPVYTMVVHLDFTRVKNRMWLIIVEYTVFVLRHTYYHRVRRPFDGTPHRVGVLTKFDAICNHLVDFPFQGQPSLQIAIFVDDAGV
jgi:hypothetical protein